MLTFTVMAYWPVFDRVGHNVSDCAMDALDSAVKMQIALLSVSQENLVEGLPELNMGIGIHTGQVVVGDIGSEKRGKYGIVGSAVNTAKRIESIAQGGTILVSGEAYSFLEGRVKVSRKLQVELKGLEGRRDLFEIAWTSESPVSTIFDM
ncbi:MAG: adenylate/guanylate cyclase domain-containing protein [Deltaproteobacteria bacterium]|nr:adenylate/guanylate cyclase domain-containing protein [Deltaproteobacteria bacterium]